MASRFLKQVVLQLEAPIFLRYYVLVPFTVAFIVLTGSLFTLPPGPLCDEGMVLFMEGGCDWGDSNIFFFSKLGALVAVNCALLYASRRKAIPLASFVPHLLLLAGLGWTLRQSGCDTYYSHPNGSLGQMALEIGAFAVLGLAVLPWIRGRGSAAVATAALLWNGFNIAAFYTWLAVEPHWTWAHTAWIAGTLLIAALVLEGLRRNRLAGASGGR